MKDEAKRRESVTRLDADSDRGMLSENLLYREVFAGV